MSLKLNCGLSDKIGQPEDLALTEASEIIDQLKKLADGVAGHR